MPAVIVIDVQLLQVLVQFSERLAGGVAFEVMPCALQLCKLLHTSYPHRLHLSHPPLSSPAECSNNNNNNNKSNNNDNDNNNNNYMF